MIKLEATSKLPTRFGRFIIKVFVDTDKKEHVALIKGELKKNRITNVRLHSKCFTGDTLTSLRCDCREQLEFAMKYINKHHGIVLYLDQEGRGIGLANKVKAYALQDGGLDTVEANEKLGFAYDLRDFRVAASILKMLGVNSVNLLTNNPGKIKGLEENGIKIETRIAVQIKPNKFNKKYLETKRKKLGHLIGHD